MEVVVALLSVPQPGEHAVPAEFVNVQEFAPTPWFAGSKVTIAVIVDAPWACNEPGFAVSETIIAWNVIPMVPDCLESLSDVAVMVRLRLFAGGVAGAL